MALSTKKIRRRTSQNVVTAGDPRGGGPSWNEVLRRHTGTIGGTPTVPRKPTPRLAIETDPSRSILIDLPMSPCVTGITVRGKIGAAIVRPHAIDMMDVQSVELSPWSGQRPVPAPLAFGPPVLLVGLIHRF